MLPPILGTLIGYFTNDIAIRMLFRPYRPWYVGRYRLPFTPGLIPSNQGRLASRIADTITRSLLTPEELQNIARRLLQLEQQRFVDYVGQILKLHCQHALASQPVSPALAQQHQSQQSYYCRQQQQNDKTRRVLERAFGNTWTERYMTTVLFDLPQA